MSSNPSSTATLPFYVVSYYCRYCVLSGPTQLSFVNKKKSSAFRKALPPPMFHRFTNLGSGFFAGIVREYGGAAADAEGDEGGSSNAAPQTPPRAGATNTLESIR